MVVDLLLSRLEVGLHDLQEDFAMFMLPFDLFDLIIVIRCSIGHFSVQEGRVTIASCDYIFLCLGSFFSLFLGLSLCLIKKVLSTVKLQIHLTRYGCRWERCVVLLLADLERFLPFRSVFLIELREESFPVFVS